MRLSSAPRWAPCWASSSSRHYAARTSTSRTSPCRLPSCAPWHSAEPCSPSRQRGGLHVRPLARTSSRLSADDAPSLPVAAARRSSGSRAWRSARSPPLQGLSPGGERSSSSACSHSSSESSGPPALSSVGSRAWPTAQAPRFGTPCGMRTGTGRGPRQHSQRSSLRPRSPRPASPIRPPRTRRTSGTQHRRRPWGHSSSLFLRHRTETSQTTPQEPGTRPSPPTATRSQVHSTSRSSRCSRQPRRRPSRLGASNACVPRRPPAPRRRRRRMPGAARNRGGTVRSTWAANGRSSSTTVRLSAPWVCLTQKGSRALSPTGLQWWLPPTTSGRTPTGQPLLISPCQVTWSRSSSPPSPTLGERCPTSSSCHRASSSRSAGRLPPSASSSGRQRPIRRSPSCPTSQRSLDSRPGDRYRLNPGPHRPDLLPR